MLDHISFGVSDLPRSIVFYDAVLTALGYERQWTSDRGVEYGPPGGGGKLALFAMGANAHPPGAGAHLALTALTRLSVDRFHEEALTHGGTDEGTPGLRPKYGPGYYAAFVRDPDGHKLEAVVHEGG